MQINRSTRLQLNLQKWLFTILLLCTIGLLAWLSTQYSWQTDWTANNRNSLSQGSIELLQTLPDEIVIHVYTRERGEVRAAIEEIQNRYKRVKPNVVFRLINPDVDIEQAQQDAVKQYGQIVVSYQGRRETINSLSEQAISSALLRLSRGSSKLIAFLQGHGERSPADDSNRGYNKLAAQLQSKGFKVISHNLLSDPLPDNTRVLVIAAPSNTVLPGELEHIDAYIKRGGNVLWLADPGELFGLAPLATELGLKFHDGMVVDNNINLRQTLRIEHPAIIPVLEYYPHAVTSNITYNTLFPLARGVEPIDDAGNNAWQHTILWRSYERSWTETGGLKDEITFSTADGDIAGPITLAVALERILDSDTVQQEKASQRIIVVGDSDFMANAYVGVGANLDLALNIFNWLAGDDDLIAVDIKNAPDLQLQLDDSQVLFIGAGFLVALPLLLIITGSIIWYRRRNR